MTVAIDTRREQMLALEAQVWFLSRRIKLKAAAVASEIAPQLGMNGFAVLEVLSQLGPIRQGDLAAQIALDKGGTSRLVAELVELELVVRRPDPRDARAHVVELSDAGRERMAEIRERRHGYFAEHLSDWSEDELRSLADGLARYNAAMTPAAFTQF